MKEELFEKMAQSIIDGDSDVSAELAQQAVAAGIDPLEAPMEIPRTCTWRR